MREQLYNILEKLIIRNNIRVNKEELNLQLSSHPSYPSLHALKGVLDHFDIPSLALRLSVNKEVLKQLPVSFIANILTDSGEELVLVEKKKRKIKITFGTTKNDLIEEEIFLSQWNGVIVAIEKDDKEANSFDDILDKQSECCTENAINFTPALYLNNTLFPQEYERTDLLYFIDDFIAIQNISIITNTKAIAS